MTQTQLRVLTASILLSIFLPALWFLPSIGVQLIFIALSFVLCLESFKLINLKYASVLAACALLLIIPIQYVFIEAIYGVLFCWAIRVVWMLSGASRKMNPYLLVAMQLLDIVVFVVACHQLYLVSRVYFLGVVATIIGIDTLGYFVGKSFGKHKLFPSISPNKSIEGYMGGLAGVVLVEGITLIVQDIPILHLTLVLLMVYILATTGDLLVSYQKRIVDVKDSGAIMPGHGGALDRFDSWIFVVPFVYLIVK